MNFCHCGRPTVIHYYNPKPFTRDLCEDCDAERCDAPVEGWRYTCQQPSEDWRFDLARDAAGSTEDDQ